jgi:hypothetical protein
MRHTFSRNLIIDETQLSVIAQLSVNLNISEPYLLVKFNYL